MMRSLLPIMLLPLLVMGPSEQIGVSDLLPSKIMKNSIKRITNNDDILTPFETKYYTDYYYGNNTHKLYREVTAKFNGQVLHCTYVGDRELIAGLIGDTDTNINEALSGVLPKTFISPINVTTDEIDQMIDSCLSTPPNATESSVPGFKKIIDGITDGAKNIASYLFIFPGTKWCGPGDVARNYSDLGLMKESDKCCRDHDHALDSIPRGESRHGLENPLFYTITNCADDNKFYSCLKDSESAHASAIGTMYFNILKTKCFSKRKQARCAKKLPFSPCQKYTYDESSEEKYQIFDPVKYQPNASIPTKMINNFLFTVPGVDNVMKLRIICPLRMKHIAAVIFLCGYLCSTRRSVVAAKSRRPGTGLVIFPGTKWCGIGNKARSYDDLGGADDTDRCCREHDRAPGGIKVGQTLHNITNNLSYTIKPCEADEKFRQCLRGVDSRISKLVGLMFFNVLRSKCYALEKPKACEKQSFAACSRYRLLQNFPLTWKLVDNNRF
ncbi:uncharacterized protein LOC111246430 [Varroa destructor]|uniref:Phospholipase A2 n=1 Tax=Varroa destructor TaxID=109461 RepID=A0A7M7JKC4_VARDE|nr:uncharacterized protein LOC111246430 [Varroa destructor]